MPHQRPKNAESDSYSYTLPHEVAFLIQELAQVEAEALDLQRLTTSDYITRTIRQKAEKDLTPEQRERAKQRAEERKQERIREAEARAEKKQASERTLAS